jgi:hypothetical protein
MFPIIGRGVGPGGSFSLPEVCLQKERSRQARPSNSNETVSIEAFSMKTY